MYVWVVSSMWLVLFSVSFCIGLIDFLCRNSVVSMCNVAWLDVFSCCVGI